MSKLSPERRLIHELRNCVAVIDLAARELPLVRTDEAGFERAHQSLQEELRRMCELLRGPDEPCASER